MSDADEVSRSIEHIRTISDSFMRRMAIRKLATVRDARVVDFLVELLGNRDDKTRSVAAEELRNFAEQRAVEPLINALEDKEYSVRAAAALTLGALRDSRSVRPLIPLLVDANGDVTAAARNALAQLGTIALPELIAVINNPIRDHSGAALRAEVAKVLGRIKNPAALEFIVDGLKLDHYATRSDYIRALEFLGDPRAAPALLDIVFHTHHSWDRAAAAEALGKIGTASELRPLTQAAGGKGIPLRWLEMLLERCAKDAALDDLTNLAQFGAATNLNYVWDGDQQAIRSAPGDTTKLRKLAADELVRRGVSR
jgi:HEAT repeat protein